MKKILALIAMAVSAVCCGNQPKECTSAESAIETIMSRKSVRKYTQEPVSDAQIETMLRAAMAAPSGIDMRPWRFVVVKDPETRAALGSQAMYKTCSVIIVVCGEPVMTLRDGTQKDNPNWTADCAAATENLLLAAHALGLGAVWTACYPYEQRMNPTREVLQLPDNVNPYCIVPIGYPDGETPVKDKWNPDNIHYERW